MKEVIISILSSILGLTLSFLGWNEAPQPLPQEVATTTPKVTPPDIKTSPISIKPQIQLPKSVKSEPKVKTSTSQSNEPIATTTNSSQTNISATAVTSTKQNPSGEDRLKQATINILCTLKSGNQIAYFSGSGVVIDPSGVILTNAHVAEHVLLEQAGRESCSIRTGSPAVESYKAIVIFLPDAWIESNKFNIGMQAITGTGENDYAFLALTSRTSRSAPDVPLPFIPINASSPNTGSSIIMAGYPLLSNSVSLLNNGLYLLTSPSIINSIAGFDGRSTDVIDTTPSSLAEHGSSGGAIVDSGYNLIGIIDSTVIDPVTGHNAIQGITTSYIKRSLENKGKSINLLIENAKEESDAFKTKINSLSSML